MHLKQCIKVLKLVLLSIQRAASVFGANGNEKPKKEKQKSNTLFVLT
jgi:hypothetical protein